MMRKLNNKFFNYSFYKMENKNITYLLSLILLLIWFLSMRLLFDIVSKEEEWIRIILYILFVLPFHFIVTVFCWYCAVKLLIHKNIKNTIEIEMNKYSLKTKQDPIKTSAYYKIWLIIRFIVHVMIWLSLIVYFVDSCIEYWLFLKEYDYNFFDIFGLWIIFWNRLIWWLWLWSIVMWWWFLKKIQSK